ncbi:hypothetical protein CU097_004733 [Rhizopus azygosporus]|uniref:Uncharacterized protein n=1 Tax=Rhizopus azygosporus TaxID=86630 RepID=A0A367J461_RHIAZ|nr:hypothetical protein CU097_004733 [Rhizopus azygosporus]
MATDRRNHAFTKSAWMIKLDSKNGYCEISRSELHTESERELGRSTEAFEPEVKKKTLSGILWYKQR